MVFMITSQNWLNATRAVGFLAYGTAVTCCAVAWIRSKSRRSSQLAAILTLIETLLLLDIAFNWRWMLHGAIGGFAQRHNEYGARRVPQVIAVSILVGVLALGLIANWRLRGRFGRLLAVSGVLLSLVLWCTEVVSLHSVDRLLYYSLDNVMAISIVWILSCAMTSIGILLDPRESPTAIVQ
jgi:hypothetical protein